MAVKIRLSRIGKKHVPFFRIVAVDSRQKRDGACLENLGTYDALNNTFIQFHEERIADWISKGAVVTDSVKKLHRLYKAIGSSKGSSGENKIKASPVKNPKKNASQEIAHEATK
jgi:small subunit ribosomal protein S16